MQHRLKTSQQTMQLLKDLQNRTNLTPNVLARLAVGLSLRDPSPLGDASLDSAGLEFNRQTLTGEHDTIFKILITQHTGQKLTDEEFFPKLFKLHLERGIHSLYEEYSYAGNYEKFILSLSKLD